MNSKFNGLEEKVRELGMEDFKIRDQEHFNKLMAMVKRKNDYGEDRLAESFYMTAYNYYMTHEDSSWSHKKNAQTKDCAYHQSWKLHVTFENEKDYKRALKILVPEFTRLDISHKLLNPGKRDLINEDATQHGKTMAIYEADLTFVQDLNDEAKAFLQEEIKYAVPSDKHLGGRVNARFTNSYFDFAMDQHGNVEYMNRSNLFLFKEDVEIKGKTHYKPSFVEEPPSLEALLTMDRTLTDAYEPHREALPFYLARTGTNNALLKEMMSKDIEMYVEDNAEDSRIRHDVDRASRFKLNYANYEGKTILDVAMTHGNEEMVQFIEQKEYEREAETVYKPPLRHEAVPVAEQKQLMIEKINKMTEQEVGIMVSLYETSEFTHALPEEEFKKYSFFDLLNKLSPLDPKQTIEAIHEHANAGFLEDVQSIMKKEIAFLQEEVKKPYPYGQGIPKKKRRLETLKEREGQVKTVLSHEKDKKIKQTLANNARASLSADMKQAVQPVSSVSNQPIQQTNEKKTTSIISEIAKRSGEEVVGGIVQKHVTGETYRKLKDPVEKRVYVIAKVMTELATKDDDKTQIVNELAEKIGQEEKIEKKEAFTAIRRSLSLENAILEKKEMNGTVLTPTEENAKKINREYARLAANLRVHETSASHQMGL